MSECFSTIEIISIDNDKRSFNTFSCTPDSMGRSPWFCSALDIACRSFFYGLHDELDMNFFFIFFNYHCLEITSDSFTNNTDDFFTAKTDHIRNSKFEEYFSIRSDRINLFQSTIPASESGRHDYESWFHSLRITFHPSFLRGRFPYLLQ